MNGTGAASTSPGPCPSAGVAAVVLAAGASTRFGTPKQLATFRGEPLVRHAARAAVEAGAAPAVVVLGAHAEPVRAVLGGLEGVRTIVNEAWSSGLASSLRVGLEAVHGVADAVLITVIDQPLVDARALRQLIDAFAAGDRIVAAEYDGVIGVPALVGREHVNDLARAATGDSGAGRWLRQCGLRVARVPLRVAALDADTTAALRAIEAGHTLV